MVSRFQSGTDAIKDKYAGVVIEEMQDIEKQVNQIISAILLAK